MANDDDEVAGDGTTASPYEPTGARRSTFTPPTGPTPSQPAAAPTPASSAGYDDDDLANALANQFPQPSQTGTIPAQTRSAVPSPQLSGLPAPSGPPVIFPQASEAPVAQAPTQTPPQTPPPAPRLDPVSGLPLPPQRRSLADADLMRSLGDESGSGATLDAIDRLEAQMRLRDQERQEFADWQNTMLSIGTPDALRALDDARPTFTGVVPVIPTPAAVQPPEQQAPPAPPVADFADSRPAWTPPPVAREAPPVRSPFAPPAAEPAAGTAGEPPVWDLVEPTVPPAPIIPPPAQDTTPAGSPFNFDDLLAGGSPAAPAGAPVPFELPPPSASPVDGPSAALRYDLSPPPPDADPVFIEPVDLREPEIVPLSTGSTPIISQPYDAEPDEDVDDTDRAFEDLLGPFPVTAEGVAILPPTTGAAPVQPLASPRVPTDEVVLRDDEPTPPPAFRVEASGDEPTPLDHRVGRAARMFWIWFATNSSVLSIAFGGALFSLGMSLRQAIVAAFVGVALSFLPLGLSTLAGKWSGQPTMITSRATFGHAGNVVPAIVAVIARLFWGAVLLWLVAISTAHILVGAKLNGPLTELQLTVIVMAAGFIIALLIAVLGYGLFARVQFVLTILSAVLVVGIVLITWPSVNISTALTKGDGPWILVLTGVVLVFSFIGLAWANTGGDLARYQRPSSSGAAGMLLAPFGSTLPAFILIAYGALLAASNPDVAKGLVTNPLDTIALMIPTWYPVPLIAATVLSLLSGVVLSIYSGGFALKAVGLRIPRAWSAVVVGVLLFVVAIALSLTVTDVVTVFRDFATTIAVPVAAWAGIFAAEMIIRRRRFDSDSLLRRGGVYPTVNWVNFIMLLVASAVGFGLTTATVSWLSWQGFLFPYLGIALNSQLAATDAGVLVALLLGLLTPFIAGVPTIRKQERARVSLD